MVLNFTKAYKWILKNGIITVLIKIKFNDKCTVFIKQNEEAFQCIIKLSYHKNITGGGGGCTSYKIIHM